MSPFAPLLNNENWYDFKKKYITTELNKHGELGKVIHVTKHKGFRGLSFLPFPSLYQKRNLRKAAQSYIQVRYQ